MYTFIVVSAHTYYANHSRFANQILPPTKFSETSANHNNNLVRNKYFYLQKDDQAPPSYSPEISVDKQIFSLIQIIHRYEVN